MNSRKTDFQNKTDQIFAHLLGPILSSVDQFDFARFAKLSLIETFQLLDLHDMKQGKGRDTETDYSRKQNHWHESSHTFALGRGEGFQLGRNAGAQQTAQTIPSC